MLSRSTRIIYGSGGAISGIKESAFSIFVLLYYTQVLGLSGTQAGFALFIAICWDVVSDPLVGAWSDRLKSRWGRRHPFMLAAIIPIGLGCIALFSPPDSIVENREWLFYWLLCSILLIRTAYTFFWIPYAALGNELSDDYHERSTLFGTRTTFLYMAIAIFPAMAFALIFPTVNGVDGRFVRENYDLYGIVSCLLIWLVSLTVTWGTKKHIPKLLERSHKIPNSPGFRGMIKELLSTLSNRNFRNLLGFDIAMSISHGIFITLNILAWTYFWELSAVEIGMLLSGSTLLAVVIAGFTGRALNRRYDKRHLLAFSVTGLIIDSLWLYPVRWLEILPENNHPVVFYVLFFHSVIWMYCYMIRIISSTSIMADIIDEHELSYALRQEGSFSAAASFTMKLAAGIGPLIGGPILDIIGLNQGMLPGEVPLTTLNGLGIAIMAGLIPLLIIGRHFSLRLDLSAEKLQQIQRQIKKRDEDQYTSVE